MERDELHEEIQSPEPGQRIEVTLVSKLSLADFQNSVPLLREICVVNDATEEVKSLELEIKSAPAFLKPKIWRIDAVGPGKRYVISDLDTQLDGTLFTRLTEAEKATVTFVLRTIGDPD